MRRNATDLLWRAWRCMMLSLCAATQSAPAPAADVSRALAPKLVVQRGHLGAPQVYAATPDGRFMLAASAYDGTIILWDTANGQELDDLPIPDVNRQNARFQRLTVSPDGHEASLWSLTPAGEEMRWVCRHYSFDLEKRGSAAIADLPGESPDCAPVASRATLPDGRAIKRDGNGFVLAPVSADGKPVTLKAAPHDGVENVDVTPDGRKMAMMRIDGLDGSKTRPRNANVQVWDIEAGKIVNEARNFPGRYRAVRWLDNDHYALLAEYDPTKRNELDAPTNTPPPTLVIEAASNDVLDTMRTLAGMLPYRSDGTMLGLGRDECAYGNIATDLAPGLWLRRPHGAWRAIAFPELAGAVVDSVGMSADGRTIAIVFRHGARCNEPGRSQILLVDGDMTYPGTPLRTRLVKSGIDPAMYAYRADFANDGSKLIILAGDGAHVIDLASGNAFRIAVNVLGISDVTSDGARLVMPDKDVRDSPVYDLTAGGKVIAKLPGDFAFSASLLPGRPWMWVAGLDGSMRYYRVSDWTLLLGQYPLQRRGFVAVDALGRYDTNVGPDAAAFRWVMADRMWQSLAGQTFMRDYYEPGLVSRTLDCTSAGNCATAFKTPPPLAMLNRVLPEMVAIDARQEGARLQVDVALREGTDTGATNGKTQSGAYDLRLFRDGHLVGQKPDPVASAAGDMDSWRNDARLSKPGEEPLLHRHFTIALPSGRSDVRLAAYAFNDDRVKGETLTIDVPLARIKPAPKRAFVIAIGINTYAEQAWQLHYAAGDATALADSVGRISDYTVIPIRLIAEGKTHQADKAQLAAVIALLAGDETKRAMLAAAGIDVRQVSKITPDDALVISFAGHGDTDADHVFYLVPQDAVRGTDGTPVWKTLISSAELTDWLRPVDAGEMAIIIDACHSAASVYTPTFKPAPMGDPGLGQLAFDKGIRILAATQGDDVAMESATLHHGLLTYTLAEDGLAAGKADLDKDGRITLDELMRYAQGRLPILSAAAAQGRPADLSARTLILDPSAAAAAPHKQQPALFDFTGVPSAVVVRQVAPGP